MQGADHYRAGEQRYEQAEYPLLLVAVLGAEKAGAGLSGLRTISCTYTA